MMKYLSDISWWKQLSLNVLTLLTSLLAALTVAKVHIDWFTSDTINAVAQFIIAFGTFFVGSVAGIINTYITERSKKKAKEVAEKYAQEQAEAAAAKVAKAKEVLATTAENPETTPSTEGPVSETNTTVQ
ncbi:hypothetical protein [Heyndrickxia ginsengihumi]|uniref:hypothetical protein n=1 Tax=Heyndrickxia ginsengihumi TaxID=363870 RepID=UPI000472B97A|nr:hypothetical protein [Heyndrickxia ginsengihumi]